VHAGWKEPHAARTGGEVQFMPYPDGPELHMLKRVVYIIEHNIYRKNVGCNRYFATLSSDKSVNFDDVWEDKDIWINLDPRPSTNFDGFNANTKPKEITIAAQSFRRNVWFVTAVLVHELAHVAGAPPDGLKSNPRWDDAEKSLLHCGLRAFYHLGERTKATATSESPPPAADSETVTA
jgi:hypothetical protein